MTVGFSSWMGTIPAGDFVKRICRIGDQENFQPTVNVGLAKPQPTLNADMKNP